MEEHSVPHYLIASSNTCPETCKYGNRPATAEMRKHSAREKLVQRQYSMRKVQPVDTKTMVSPKLSSDRKDQLHNNTTQIIKHTISSLKKVDVAAKTKTKTFIALKSPTVTKSCAFPLKLAITGTRNSDVKIVKDAGSSIIVHNKGLELPRASGWLSSKTCFNTSLNTKHKTVKAVAAPPAKNQKKEVKNETKPMNNEKVIEKTLYMIEPKSEEVSLEPCDSHIILSSLPCPPLLPNEGETSKDEDNREDKDLSKKVILRHQEAEGKKDVHGLYNSVIKETASKLVEVKRSKVRALVGAFESVISLQESNKTFSHY